MSKATLSSATKPRGIRQTMSDLHIWTGLLVGWVLYAVFLTGTFSFFREEISRYMRPEHVSQFMTWNTGELIQRTVDQWLIQNPDLRQISIQLPTERKPIATVLWQNLDPTVRRFQSVMLDPATGNEWISRDTQGGEFFYRFHFNLHYMSALWARWLVGFCAMFMLVAIVSGVITHKKIFADFFTFRPRKGQRSWLDAHVALSVFGLPFHFMITWSGLITLMVLYMPWGWDTLPTPEQKSAVINEMRFFQPAGPPTGIPTTLKALTPMVQQAEQRWGVNSVGVVQISNPGDASARVTVIQNDLKAISTTPTYLIFDGATGELLHAKEYSGPIATTQGVLYGLHLGRFADLGTRWLYFLLGLAGTAMVGSGLVLWSVKRRLRLPQPDKPYFGFYLVERLNIATIAGLSVAAVGFFWMNRWLPLDLMQRSQWEIHGFFLIWFIALIWAFIRPAKCAWVELLCVATILGLLLPICNVLGWGQGVPSSLVQQGWLFWAVDLSIGLLALAHGWMAWRVAKHQRPTKRIVAEKAAPVRTISTEIATRAVGKS